MKKIFTNFKGPWIWIKLKYNNIIKNQLCMPTKMKQQIFKLMNTEINNCQ